MVIVQPDYKTIITTALLGAATVWVASKLIKRYAGKAVEAVGNTLEGKTLSGKPVEHDVDETFGTYEDEYGGGVFM